MHRSIDEHLISVPLFASLSKKQLRVLSAITTEARVRTGESVVTEGATGQELILIIDGEAETRRGDAVVGAHGAGDFFGETGLLADHPWTESVVATSDLHIEVIDRRSFRGLVADHPDIGRSLNPVIEARLAELEG